MLRSFLLTLLVVSASLLSAQSGTIQHDGVQREYFLYIPSSYSHTDTLPLVFCLHGLLQSHTRIAEVAELTPIAEREKFIVCYPLGIDTAWNSFGNPHTGKDDIGFFSALIDTLHAQYHINLDRVYAMGMSNGGFMSYSLACMLSDRIAAIASIAGSTTDSIIHYCEATRPVPIMEIHGDADWLVNYNGGFVGLSLANNSIDSTLRFWTLHNNCTGSPDITQLADVDTTDNCTVTRKHWAICDDSEVIHYRINNGGHTWPGSAVDFDGLGGNVNHDFEASEVVWEFFSRYSLQGKITAVPSVKANEILMYPNPVQDNLVIDLRETDVQLIRVTDLSGKLMKTVRPPQRTKVFISFEELPEGMFLIYLLEKAEAITKKVVHQK